MRNNLFNILKDNGHVESAKNFEMKSLMDDVKMYETETHLYIENFPGAFGDTQNKNNRVYDQDTLVFAVNWFNDIKDENPYFCYMFDGHKDDDSYENIVGRVIELRLREDIKCVMMDMKVNKGAKSQPTIRNIIEDGDPLGTSMRILSPNSINVSKDDLQEINPDIIFLNDDDANIAYLMSKDSDIEYITGESFIWRFDITQFPSFNDAFVAKTFKFSPEFNKKESALHTFNIPKMSSVKLSDHKTSSTLFALSDKCVTNACKFRHTMKDFVDLISMDESITTIKDNPALYEDMIKFSYINLSSFEFDKIVDHLYLQGCLSENEIHKEEVDTWRDIIDSLTNKEENIISYIMDNKEYNITKINLLLNSTLNATIDADNVFYQIIAINYLHYVILSTIILTGKVDIIVSNQEQLNDKLINGTNDQTDDVVLDLIKEVKDNGLNVYNYTNTIFSYIYKYVEKYADKMAPITLVNESFKIFRPIKKKGVVTNKWVK